MEKKRKSTDETSSKSPPKRKAAESGSATQPAEQETDRQGETESDRETKTAESGSVTQPAEQETDRQEETGSDRETKKQAPLMQHQQESSASVSSPDLDKKSTEPHVTHSFRWFYEDGKRTYSCTCDKAGTVEEVLRRSHEFKKIQDKKKRQDKELVVRKDRKAISSHFPCCLIQDDHLTVTFIKAVDKEKKSNASGSRSRKRKPPSNKLVTFHVLTKGGENIQRVLNSHSLANNVNEVTVYAYEGEKVKHALQRDERFMGTVFQKTCALSETSTETTVELSSLVDHHDGKTFQIVQLSRDAPPSSLEMDLVQNETEVSPSDENQSPAQQLTSTELEKVDKPKPDGNMAPRSDYEIPNSEKLHVKLTLIFKEAVKGLTASKIQNLFHVEFGKKEDACSEVKTMKQMMKHSDSVCFIRTPKKVGSGFLLFDKFVLTNGHVLKDIYNESTGQLNEKVIAHFSFESYGHVGPAVEVRNVVGYEYSSSSGQTYDWALLELSENQKLPSGLPQHFPDSQYDSQYDGICIIGHPKGEVKKIDTCFVVSAENRDDAVEARCLENPEICGVTGLEPEAIVMITKDFFKNKNVVTYGSCFHKGASGSPVFDEKGNVVAMHSGGFAYKGKSKDNSIIDFGYPLFVIVQRLIIQLVKGKKLDVLKKYLSCCKYVRLRNYSTELVKNEHLKDPENKTLKEFLEFLCQKEEHVIIEIESSQV